MKTDTPETDAMWTAYYAGDADNADLSNLMIRLERERDEARKGWNDEIRKSQEDLRRAEVLFNTANEQRDRLAEALKRIMNIKPNDHNTDAGYWSFQFGRCEGIAKSALAAVKGADHET